MKMMNFDKPSENAGGPYIKDLNKAEVLAYLIQLDSKLQEDLRLELCGSASVLLRSVDFRSTSDIDICGFVRADIAEFVLKSCGRPGLFDFAAAGVVNLFCDYEERLVHLDLGFKHLDVWCLSARDWIVSKLASPKLEDVLKASDITLDDLFWVRDNFSEKFSGVGEARAFNDLNWLIREFSERG